MTGMAASRSSTWVRGAAVAGTITAITLGALALTSIVPAPGYGGVGTASGATPSLTLVTQLIPVTSPPSEAPTPASVPSPTLGYDKPGQTSPEPTVSATPATQPSATVTPVTGPQVLNGRMLKADGTPAAGVSVWFLPDTTFNGEATVNADPMGTVVTDSTGRWTYTMPTTLPSAAQAASDANSGVLNVMVLSTAGVTGTSMKAVAMTMVPVGVAAGSATTKASVDARAALAGASVTQTLHLNNPAAVPPTDAQIATSPAALGQLTAVDGGYQSTLGETTIYNPDVVGGTNFSSAVLVPQNVLCDSGPPGLHGTKVGTTVSETKIGEGHAFWDAYTDVKYVATQQGGWAVGLSVDLGKHWVANGTATEYHYMGISAGVVARGPWWGHQVLVPFNYYRYRWTDYCQQYWYDTVTPGPFHADSTHPITQVGGDVSSWDGPAQWQTAKARTFMQPQPTFETSAGRGYNYGGGYTGFGFSGSVYTAREVGHQESITAGAKTTSRHDIFSNDGCFCGGNPPKIVYSW